jgi:hypothetical protein
MCEAGFLRGISSERGRYDPVKHRRTPCGVAVVCLLLCSVGAGVSRAQGNPPAPDAPTDAQAGQTPVATSQATGGTATDTDLIQEEVGDRDITYLRTRAVFRYDYTEQDGPTETNRFRLKLVYGFGKDQRFGLAVNVPVVWSQTPTGTVFGSGDTDVTGGVIVYQTNKLRTGFVGEITVPTSSENALGGGSTNLKGSWAITYVLSKRFEFNGALSYKQSVSTWRGEPVKQFEPDLTLNMQVLKTTWFVESDSYYDFIPEQYAPMIKTGLARAWGESKSWTTSAYIEWPLSSYARATQHHLNVGLDVTWFPFKER